MNKHLTPGHIARVVGGEIAGEHGAKLLAPSSFHEAGPDALTFYEFNDIIALSQSRAGCVITSLKPPKFSARALIVVPNVRLAWARALAEFQRVTEEDSLTHTYISTDASVDPSARILPFTYIGPEVRIGPDCIIGPNVTIHAGCEIGARVRIGAGSVIGSPGFGYAADEEGNHHHIPHLGTVIIQEEVEIGAGVTIDRGTVGQTRIGKGTKIDNLVHIAHNVVIGKRCLIAGQSGIAGSSILEDDVKLAGQVGIKDHVRIGKGAIVLAKSAVFKDVAPGQVVSGTPARPHREALKAQAKLYRDAADSDAKDT